ncbi:leucine--tRNA ligase [Flavobacteriaceae bacterium 14752]|uniref:leucine--tRNA ligase n=1 Tax=Mesohalobacter salilacus TaxID=2491711 RepID=UPI000F64075B|nr:leucine--tRNA ligase [Flavobacteriaceae bacterium 14752]
MAYQFKDIEAKWQKFWAENKTFKAQQPFENQETKKPFYVLDMFPYPSGAGLHVGHPLGYIASDIYARYKRHQGYNVLHPQGYDSFGLPAEQYAIQTGQHPAKTTQANIKRYREQLDRIGFSFDWDREVRTSNPKYYRWTQWIFIQLFGSYYDYDDQKAKPIDGLVKVFDKQGNDKLNVACDEDIVEFTAEDWKEFSEDKKEEILLQYRLTYLAETEVNWCPALGTVLANDEIVNGLSERGGHPVEQKKMKQWSMRISAYAERLLQGLENLDWSDSIKEAQRNWIGKSIGALIQFKIQNSKFKISAFTTRPDTIFGVSFMTLAPEHELVEKITTPEQKEAVEAYIKETAKRSERDRLADVKTISGVFTGAYAEHPLTQQPIPIWIGDYVLAGYGTGAVMAVPCGDQRDYDFAKHFNIPIPNIFKDTDISKEAFGEKDNTLITNSDFLDDLPIKKAIKVAIQALEDKGVGQAKTNYRLRDAVFSRQRYWGEPFPVYYENGLPKMIDEKHLPLKLPEVEKYLPTEDGEPPLGRAQTWAWNTKSNQVVDNNKIDHKTVFPLELNTMPGWAGSSWYMFRYMETKHRDEVFASQDALDYWQNVNLYVGGSEHATGHLLYSRFWTKFLKDRGFLNVEEPFQRMINQGMILGESPKALLIPEYLTEEDFNKISNEAVDEDGFITGLPDIAPKILKDKSTYKYKNWRVYPTSLLKYLNKNIEFKIENIPIEFVYKEGENFIFTLKKIRDIRLKYPKFNNLRIGTREHLSQFNLDNNEIPIIYLDKVILEFEVEKMSKSKYNVVNPDDVCDEYGADALRLFEMFLGPIDQAKPWNTAGLSGVVGFLKKLWKLYHQDDTFAVSDEKADKKALKVLHQTIKKVNADIEDFSFNTSVSSFMICVNELTQLKCSSREILEPLCVLVAPFAPHIAEELWEKLGHQDSVSFAEYPRHKDEYLVEDTKTYPISFNGKMRFTLDLDLSLSKEEIENIVMQDERTQKQLQGRTPKKVIVVPGKIVNIVG